MTSLLGITLFVLALMLAIFLHEGGHFTTAKLFGMKVERFFLGFGPTIWSFRRGETEYGIKALPLGGFCKIAGMSPYENDGNFLEEDRSANKPAVTPTPPERQFRNKPAWQRAIVLPAGSFTHFIVAILLIWMVLVAIGALLAQGLDPFAAARLGVRKHLSGRDEFAAMVRGATPDVVLTGVELLARGWGDRGIETEPGTWPAAKNASCPA